MNTKSLLTDSERRELVQRQAAEIARLRELKTPASRKLLNITKECLDSAEAECASLHAALETMTRSAHLLGLDSPVDTIGQLRTENGQLRAALARLLRDIAVAVLAEEKDK
jgi:hypothetical protein